MKELLSLNDVESIAHDVLTRAGTAPENARIAARSIRQAEAQGLREAGLGALPDIVEHLRCGRVDGRAAPRIVERRGTTIVMDADGGFACPAIEAGMPDLLAAARSGGLALMRVINAYPLANPAQAAAACAAQGVAGLCLATTPPATDPGPARDGAAAGCMALALPQPGGATPLILRDGAAAGGGWAGLVALCAGDGGAAVPFAGPLGGPFRTGHCLMALMPEMLPDRATPDAPDLHPACHADPIGVPATLLERIITA